MRLKLFEKNISDPTQAGFFLRGQKKSGAAYRVTVPQLD